MPRGRKYVELPIGAKFGMLTVLERGPDKILKSGHHQGTYKCLCDCGTETIVGTTALKNGTTKSCGCLKKAGLPVKSLVGQTFGKLLVLEEAEIHVPANGGKSYHMWRCLCECGREVVKSGANLASGHTNSCGYCSIDEKYDGHVIVNETGQKFIDLTGMQFGRLEVISRGPDRFDSKGEKHIQWWTKCSCGNPDMVLADGKRLKHGTKKSCGCLIHEGTPKDLTGMTINGYEVIGLDEIKTWPSGKQIKWWKCKDNEGNELSLPAYRITAGTGKKFPERQKHNRFEVCGAYTICYTDDDKSFIIDTEDLDKIKDYYWQVDKRNGYVETHINRKRIALHRFIMGAKDGEIVDHINHQLTDNRKVNLRIVTVMQNRINSKLRANNSSGCTGVYYQNGKMRKHWMAEITVNKQAMRLGSFETFEEAVAARKAAEEKYFGEFSYDSSMASVPAVDSKPGDEVAIFEAIVPDRNINNAADGGGDGSADDSAVDGPAVDPTPEFDVIPDDAVLDCCGPDARDVSDHAVAHTAAERATADLTPEFDIIPDDAVLAWCAS